MLLLGAGPVRCSSRSRIPGRRRRRRALRLPLRSVAAPRRDAAQLPADHLRLHTPRRAARSAGSTRCIGASPVRATRHATPSWRCGSMRRWSTRPSSPTTRWLGPLPRERAARFYAETLPLGRAFGVPADRLPADLDAFEGYLATMLSPSGPVHPDDTARELADAILRPPLPGVLGRLPVPPSSTPGACGRRSSCCRRPSPTDSASRRARARQLVSRWLVAGWRAWRPLAAGRVPADAAGPRRGPPPRPRPSPRPTVSRSSGTAARTSSRPGSSRSPRRTPRAASSCSTARTGGPRRTP